MSKLKIFIVGHKAISVGGGLLLLGGIYWGHGVFFPTVVETRYVLAKVEKGMLITSISGSGQVAAGNQVDLTPKATGEVIWIGVKSGQEVKKGTLVAQIDARDAAKAVRDAQVNLESTKLSLEKLTQPADNLSLIQSENTLARANESKANAESSLVKAYDDGFNTVSNAFLDLPAVMAGLQDTLFTMNAGLSLNEASIDFYTSAAARYDDKANTYRTDTYDKYQAARKAYDATFAHYKTLSRTSSQDDIQAIITESYDTTKIIADAVKSTNNLIQFYKDKLTERNLTPKALADTHLTTLSGYTAKTNTHLGNLLAAGTTIKSDQDAIVNAMRTISEQTESLAKLKSGANALDVQSSQLSVTQRENALRDAEEKLADYYVRAPFDGTIAKMNGRVGDTAGNATVLATLITKQKLATVSLNEVDVAKVKVGQKTTLTFDAVEGLTISGEVAEIDTVGTVSQGVVTYAVKISFDTDDDRVKPGMSVSATIITEVKQDVLTVPQSAVKTEGNAHYVEVFEPALSDMGGNQGVTSPTLPTQKIVTTGLSNDTSTEIVSGLVEGDQIVTRTITASASTQKTAPSAPSLFGSPRGGGGGAFRGGGG